jgi:CRISPR-associated protein Cas1
MPTLPTAIVARQGARVHLDGGRLLIEHPDLPTATLPLGQIGGLVLLGRVECSTGALLALADRGLACVLATGGGRVRAVIAPPTQRGAALRGAQHMLEASRASSDGCAPAPLRIARSIVVAKLDAILGILAQHHRTHADVELSGPINAIRTCRERAADSESIDRLRGFEGAAAAQYFAAFPAICRGELSTSTRTRQPPRDPVNAALSFGYSLIVGELSAVIIARGLDPALGFLHPPADGRPSLALDLVEPLRHAIIDRLVLRAANRRELVRSDFEAATPDTEYAPEPPALSDGVRFTDAGRAKFLRLYHEAMEGEIVTADRPPRPTRTLLSAAVEAYELELAVLCGPDASMPKPSEILQPAVTGVCESTNFNSTDLSLTNRSSTDRNSVNSSSTSTSPNSPGSTDTQS